MKFNRNTPYVFIALSTLWLSHESRATEVSLLGGLGMHSTRYDTPVAGATSKGINSIVFGATFDFPVGPAWSFETGALYGSHEGRSEVDAQNYVDFRQKGVTIPFLVRHHFGSMLSVGAGGYYSLGTGNTMSTTTAGGTTGSEVDTGTKTADDYGWVGSLKFEAPIGGKLKFALEGRYHSGLKSVDVGGSSAKFTDVLGLAGFVIAL